MFTVWGNGNPIATESVLSKIFNVPSVWRSGLLTGEMEFMRIHVPDVKIVIVVQWS